MFATYHIMLPCCVLKEIWRPAWRMWTMSLTLKTSMWPWTSSPWLSLPTPTWRCPTLGHLSRDWPRTVVRCRTTVLTPPCQKRQSVPTVSLDPQNKGIPGQLDSFKVLQHCSIRVWGFSSITIVLCCKYFLLLLQWNQREDFRSSQQSSQSTTPRSIGM